MTSVYTGNPSKEGEPPIDAIRFAVGDTIEPYRLTDQEILTIWIDCDESLAQSKINAAFALESKYTGDVDKKIGDLSVNTGSRHKQYSALVSRLEQQRNRKAMPFAGGIANKSAFRRDLHGS